MPTASDAVRFIETLYEAYNDRDLGRWLSGFAQDALWVNVPTGERFRGMEGQQENYTAWSTAFPRGRCEDLVVRGSEDVVVAEFKGVGVHEGPLETPAGRVEPTLRATSLPFCDVHTISSGKVKETHRYWDLAGAAAQLGL